MVEARIILEAHNMMTIIYQKVRQQLRKELITDKRFIQSTGAEIRKDNLSICFSRTWFSKTRIYSFLYSYSCYIVIVDAGLQK